ncbi:protein of unknown function [Acidithiobacillus ferrivorans]|uniref:DUF2846 domain-containing protein n=1 Tax=Acidithiobacillus ferrivorans TaxID=160808 RepID=A0ABY1MLU4_9PROT|nr:protein of unknown function [Acidithiobacillus ferrivorans]
MRTSAYPSFFLVGQPILFVAIRPNGKFTHVSGVSGIGIFHARPLRTTIYHNGNMLKRLPDQPSAYSALTPGDTTSMTFRIFPQGKWRDIVKGDGRLTHVTYRSDSLMPVPKQ